MFEYQSFLACVLLAAKIRWRDVSRKVGESFFWAISLSAVLQHRAETFSWINFQLNIRRPWTERAETCNNITISTEKEQKREQRTLEKRRKDFKLNCKVKNLWHSCSLSLPACTRSLRPLLLSFSCFCWLHRQLKDEENGAKRERRKSLWGWKMKKTLKRCCWWETWKGFDCSHPTSRLIQSQSCRKGVRGGKSLANLRAFDLHESFAFSKSLCCSSSLFLSFFIL